MATRKALMAAGYYTCVEGLIHVVGDGKAYSWRGGERRIEGLMRAATEEDFHAALFNANYGYDTVHVALVENWYQDWQKNRG